MRSFIIDTNVFSNAMKADDPYYEEVAERWQEAKEFLANEKEAGSQIFVSETTVAEVEAGLLDLGSESEQHRQLAELGQYPTLGHDPAVFAEIQSDLSGRGASFEKGSGENDMKIAATAKTHNLPIVTDNQKDFQHIRGIEIEAYGKSNEWKKQAGDNINADRDAARSVLRRFNDKPYDKRINSALSGTGADDPNGLHEGEGAMHRIANQSEAQIEGASRLRDEATQEKRQEETLREIGREQKKQRVEAEQAARIAKEEAQEAREDFDNRLRPPEAGTDDYSAAEIAEAGTRLKEDRVADDQPQSLEDLQRRNSEMHWGARQEVHQPQFQEPGQRVDWAKQEEENRQPKNPNAPAGGRDNFCEPRWRGLSRYARFVD